MAQGKVERRLVAILAADVVGYSRLMGADDVGTHAALKTHRKELVDPKIDEYNGRIVKLMGDGMLVEFASVVEATQCAVEIQRAMALRNVAVPEDLRIEFRIGINIGDIIVEGDDIHGDGVNIAARLEGLAEPGGICIRRAVRNQVRDKLPYDFEDMGEIEVKNIARPVHVFRVNIETPDAPRGVTAKPAASPAPRWRFPALVASAAAVAVAAAAVLWLEPWTPRVEAAAVENMAHPLPTKPSIAVLPFDNMSDDPTQEYFADGMTDDLITDLSKIAGLFVISRNSTFTYKGEAVKIRDVAEDLGVRYILEGSVRRVGDQVRINAQLIDAITGYHLWAERYDGTLADIFAIQDKVIGQIVAALALSLTTPASAETVAVSEEPASPEKQSAAVSETPLQLTAETDTPQAYDAFLEGWEHYRRQTAEDAGKAIPAFERAIEIDPGYGRAYAGLAAVYWDIANLVWYDILGIEWQHALNLAQENLAKALEDPTSKALAVSAEMLAMQGRNDEALAAIERAIALDANDPDNYISKARILSILGQAVEAEKNVHLAMRLNPFHRQELRALGRSLLHQERYEEAAETMERVVGKEWTNVYDYQTLASIYGHLGRLEDADAAVRKYNEIYGEWKYTPMTVQEAGYWWYGDMYDYDKAYVAGLREGLRKAGVPEGTAPRTDDFDFVALMSKSVGLYAVEGATGIDAATAKAMHERGVVFIDVRDAGSYARGHIPGTVHLDLNVALTEESLSRAVGQNDEVVFLCWSEECPYSAYAAAKAVTWGFTRVYRFSGGFPAWKDAGYPVETFKGY